MGRAVRKLEGRREQGHIDRPEEAPNMQSFSWCLPDVRQQRSNE
jgi:hypothetical protein